MRYNPFLHCANGPEPRMVPCHTAIVCVTNPLSPKKRLVSHTKRPHTNASPCMVTVCLSGQRYLGSERRHPDYDRRALLLASANSKQIIGAKNASPFLRAATHFHRHAAGSVMWKGMLLMMVPPLRYSKTFFRFCLFALMDGMRSMDTLPVPY